jgi:hypothetical protein
MLPCTKEKVNGMKLDTLTEYRRHFKRKDPICPRPLWVGRKKQLRNQTTQLPLGHIAMFGPEKTGSTSGIDGSQLKSHGN